MDSKESILIVDDDESTCRSLTLIFRREGYEIDTAQTGQEAIEKARGRYFNMVLLDIKLPDIEGVKLITPLKEMHPDIVILMITAHASLETATQALNEGASAYVNKPLNMDEVLATVRESLEKQRLVTENRQLLKELQVTNRRLEETLDELKSTQQKLIQQERLRALGRMSSSITHDFSNALTPILGYSDLMLTVPDVRNDSEKVTHYLELINMTAKDAAEIISNLRNFYRQRDETDILAPVNPVKLVEQAIELTQPRWKDEAQARGITIDIVTDLQEVPPVSGNSLELQDALRNLIFNAVDAIEEDGTITIRTKSDDEHIILEVSDTGVGMPDEVQQRCFEPFFTTKDERGAGLGLSMVYGIIRRHDGTIEVESEEGKGTTFIIRFPILREVQVETAREEITPPVRPLHVLYVEDRLMVREVITQYLLVDGHTVETAINGREGLEKFREGKFDLVITDRQMPDMNGDRLAADIKQIAPRQPVIMLTGYGNLMKYAGEMPEGVDLLLSKPITLNDFREALVKMRRNYS